MRINESQSIWLWYLINQILTDREINNGSSDENVPNMVQVNEKASKKVKEAILQD